MAESKSPNTPNVLGKQSDRHNLYSHSINHHSITTKLIPCEKHSYFQLSCYQACRVYKSPLLHKKKPSLNQVVNTLKERISLAGYAQLGYTYDDAAKPDNTFDIKRIIFMAHGKITKRWTCDFMYDFYNGGMLLEVYTDYQFLPGLTARIGEFKVPYTIENELSPTTVELINCYSQSVCYLAGVSGSDKCYGMTSGRDIGMMIHGKLFHDFLQYKVAVINGQGLNTKDKNSQKDVVGNLMIYPLEWLSVGGSFIRGTGHAIADSEYTGIKTGENYAKKRWSAGGGCYHFPFQSAYRISRRQGPERKK